MPPTWLHPASLKIKPTKPEKDAEAASMASTATFSSRVGLIKDSVKRRLPTSYKEYRARRDAETAAALVKEKEVKKSRESRPRPDYNGGHNLTQNSDREIRTDQAVDIARKNTAEAYFIFATLK